MLVEEVEVEDDAPRFEQSERLDLPDFMREEVRLLMTMVLPDETIETADSTTLKAAFTQAVQSQAADQIQNNGSSDVRSPTGLTNDDEGVIAQGVQPHRRCKQR